MSDGVHLLIPFAGASAEPALRALDGVPLPHLQALLARMAPDPPDEPGPQALSMPHERVLARAWGLEAADGELPLAAHAVRQQGGEAGSQAWAWITPCHLRVASDHLLLLPPQQLALDEAQSRVLLAAMAPYFAEDGLELAYQAPLRWLARGEPLRGLATASTDRAAGRSVEPWLPRGPGARTLRRLQQEMQMLLYTLPCNDEREAQGLLPVNSFWVSGAGALPPELAPCAAPPPQVDWRLRDAALQGDWAAWAQAWRELDAGPLAALAATGRGAAQRRLTLCGERAARSWSTAGLSAWSRLLHRLRPPPPIQALELL